MITQQEYKFLKDLVTRLGKRFEIKPNLYEGVNMGTLINKYFDVPVNAKGTHTVFLSSSEIQSYLHKKAGVTIGVRLIGLTMPKLGFTNEVRKVAGKGKRGYSVIIRKDVK